MHISDISAKKDFFIYHFFLFKNSDVNFLTFYLVVMLNYIDVQIVL